MALRTTQKKERAERGTLREDLVSMHHVAVKFIKTILQQYSHPHLYYYRRYDIKILSVV